MDKYIDCKETNEGFLKTSDF